MHRLVAGLVLFILSSGCKSTQPIEQWQQQFTRYTMEQANGDINVLRESAQMRSTRDARPAQIRFDHNDMPGGGLTDRRLDARGILVGQHARQGSPVFYFLVGIVERNPSRGQSQLADVRLVSCFVENGLHHWNVSPPDPSAVSRYLAHAPATSADMAVSSPAFPLIHDDFRFEVRDGYARTTEARSSAEWQMPVD